jgi:hypothetical protein
MVDSTRIIGDKQFQKAWVIFLFLGEQKKHQKQLSNIVIYIMCSLLLVDRACIM